MPPQSKLLNLEKSATDASVSFSKPNRSLSQAAQYDEGGHYAGGDGLSLLLMVYSGFLSLCLPFSWASRLLHLGCSAF